LKTFCEIQNHWLYSPVDTSILCENRAKRFSECRRCKWIEPPKVALPRQREPVPRINRLNVDKNKWIEAVKQIQEEYGIRGGNRQDETSARRIAISIGELYLSEFRESNLKAIFNVPIVEKGAFDLAVEYRLTCGPLEREERVKPHMRKHVLCTWGVDKTSGVEGYTTQLKEWTAEALLGISETVQEEEEYGADREDESRRPLNFGERSFEGIGLEETGIG